MAYKTLHGLRMVLFQPCHLLVWLTSSKMKVSGFLEPPRHDMKRRLGFCCSLEAT